jgi:lysophospholipase L1-like esterase
MEDYLLMCQPTEGQRIVQFGWGGETASGFQGRLGTDVLPFHPTVATTCYGMNDGRYAPMAPATGDGYRANMTKAVDLLKQNGVRAIVVGSPGAVDTTTFKRAVSPEAYNETLGALGGIAREVAEKEGFVFADVHQPMLDAMAKAKEAYGADYAFSGGDGVHPGANGHLSMACAFLKGLGCDGAIGTVTLDFAAGKAEGTPGQKIVSASAGSVEVESTRYPFCFTGTPDKPEQTSAAVVRFSPFNADLNRYVLVVKGLPGAKAKVTWGSQSKEFASADLAKGVNLAAEFLDNPFAEPFAKVDAAVRKQQELEVTLVKGYLHVYAQFKPFAGPDADALERIATHGIAQDKELFDAAVAAVVPVRHTIQIQPVP